MKYLSVCSGIEAASVAWEGLGWEPVGFSEIEKFPAAVLQHRFPSVPNYGDLTRFEEWNLAEGSIDVLVGGTPCQSFSIAGLRGGLADQRGNLSLTYCRLVDQLRPRWFVWENVPGVLSSHGGRDFGSILGAMAQIGYSFAWRILDAQFFGVPQRRRRVFVVGHSGDWTGPAAVLFEPNSVPGDPAPCGKAGSKVAALTSTGVGTCGADDNQGQAGHLIASITSHYGKGVDSDCTIPLVTHALRADGFDASEDGTGRGTPLVTVPCLRAGNVYNNSDSTMEAQMLVMSPLITSTGDTSHCLNAGGMGRQDYETETMVVDSPMRGTHNETFDHQGFTMEFQYASEEERNAYKILRVLQHEVGTETFAKWGFGILDSLQRTKVLQQALHGIGIRPAPFSKSWPIHCAISCEKGRSEGAMCSVWEAECERRTSQRRQLPEQLARELGAYLSKLSQPGAQEEMFLCDMWKASEGDGVLQQALSAIQKTRTSIGSKGKPEHTCSSVRRLTPEEAEFLQGFPRFWTAIPWRNKPASECPDGPRYKAIGNSMAVPVMRWIGQRIAAVEALR